MRIIALATATAALAIAAPVIGAEPAPQQRSWGGTPHAQLKPPMHGGMRWSGGKWNGGGHRWGGRWQGRWHGGYRAPGGWGGYRRAFIGYQLPSYWIQPSYVLQYNTYALPAPRAGYAWTRYYDDAVMIDREGRVHDLRQGLDWDRYDGGYEPGERPFDDGPYDGDFDGPGDPDGGWADRGPGAGFPPPGAHGDRPHAPPPQAHDGHPDRRHGSWRDDRDPPQALLHAPGRNPAIVPSGNTVIINGVAYAGGGTIANGFYYPPASVTTITVSQPSVHRTVTYETVRSAPAKRWKAKPRKRWKPKPKCAC